MVLVLEAGWKEEWASAVGGGVQVAIKYQSSATVSRNYKIRKPFQS